MSNSNVNIPHCPHYISHLNVWICCCPVLCDCKYMDSKIKYASVIFYIHSIDMLAALVYIVYLQLYLRGHQLSHISPRSR